MDPALFLENERTAPTASERQFVEIGSLACDSGVTLPGVTVAYQTWGTLTRKMDNAVLVLHALSGDSHATGWWGRIVGPGRPIDTDRFFVVCSNCLGGCQGTTGPASIAEDGKPYGSRFPVLTVRDMVEAQARLLDHLGIERLLAVAGGSMGGMQALQWTVQYPSRVCKAFATASCAAHSAMQIGFNEACRQAILRDPNWKGGDYYDGYPPENGLAVARMIGHLSFLSEMAFESKFSRRLQERASVSYSFGVDYQIESYLNYQGDKFARRFDANSLLTLTKAIDYFHLDSLTGAQAEFLFVSFTSDWLYPTHQVEIAHQIARHAACRSRHEIVDLPYGHDAFLLDGEIQGSHLRRFLAE